MVKSSSRAIVLSEVLQIKCQSFLMMLVIILLAKRYWGGREGRGGVGLPYYMLS